jgi:beta-glucosidase
MVTEERCFQVFIAFCQLTELSALGWRDARNLRMSTPNRRRHCVSPWGLWGTIVLQIEGAVNEDGRGRSIWDTFAHTPGKIEDGSNADRANDHYHRYKEDVGLIRDFGVRAYRCSIAWPRVFPEGSGAPNPKGLDFYNRLVDELLKNGIEPYATLYHWDLPQALQDRVGWQSATPRGVRDYAGCAPSA